MKERAHHVYETSEKGNVVPNGTDKNMSPLAQAGNIINKVAR
jgi:hypothetical protein